MDAGNNFWQFHHFLKAFCILPPAEGNEIVEWVGLRDSKCTLVLQRCWTSKCPQGAPRSLSGTGSAQAHRNLKGLSSWWLVIAGAKDWSIGWLSAWNQVALLPNPQSRDWDCEKVAQEGFGGLDGSSTGKPSEGSPRLSGRGAPPMLRAPRSLSPQAQSGYQLG